MSGSRDLALVAVLASAASASLTLLVSASLRPDVPPAPPPLTAADFKAALADLESQVAGLRREMAERGASSEPWVSPPLSAPRATGGPSPVAAPGAEPFRPGSENASGEPTTAHLLHFRELYERDEDGDTHLRPEAKRRWLFRGEREVIEWFGIPGHVELDESGSEFWRYELTTGEKDEDGEPVVEGFSIRMNRGRLIAFDE